MNQYYDSGVTAWQTPTTQRPCEQKYMLSATKQLVFWYCISWLEVNDTQNDIKPSVLIHIILHRPSIGWLVCGRDTSSKEDGSFRSFQSASTSILGPYSSKTDCAVFIEIPWPKSCQHHRVLATTKSTDCLAAWHEKGCRKKSLSTHGAARCRMSKRLSQHTYAIFCQTL